MKYVHTIRRIIAIDKALDRIEWDNHRYDDISDRLWDKRCKLSQSLGDYTSCPDRTNRELRRYYANRRKQVKLACKLLGVDYFAIIR